MVGSWRKRNQSPFLLLRSYTLTLHANATTEEEAEVLELPVQLNLTGHVTTQEQLQHQHLEGQRTANTERLAA